jgi:hypothetical protein
MSGLVSEVVETARRKTEAYLPQIDAARTKTVSATDLEGAVPYTDKYVGKWSEWVERGCPASVPVSARVAHNEYFQASPPRAPRLQPLQQTRVTRPGRHMGISDRRS